MAKISKSQSAILYAILMIVFGIAFVVGGAGTASWVMGAIVTVIGVLVIVSGIFSLMTLQPLTGVVEITIGVVLIVFAWTIGWIAFIILGAALFAYGVLGILKHQGLLFANVFALLIGALVICMAFGVQGAWEFINIFYYIVGALMIVDGVLMLFRK